MDFIFICMDFYPWLKIHRFIHYPRIYPWILSLFLRPLVPNVRQFGTVPKFQFTGFADFQNLPIFTDKFAGRVNWNT